LRKRISRICLQRENSREGNCCCDVTGEADGQDKDIKIENGLWWLHGNRDGGLALLKKVSQHSDTEDVKGGSGETRIPGITGGVKNKKRSRTRDMQTAKTLACCVAGKAGRGGGKGGGVGNEEGARVGRAATIAGEKKLFLRPRRRL